MNRLLGSPFPTACVACVLLLCVRPAAALDLERGDALPRIELSTLDGEPVDTAALEGEIVLLLFGETSHERTRVATIQILAALDDPQLAETPVTTIVLLSKHSDPADVGTLMPPEASRWRIVHDVERVAFGAYRVVAMPSVVVADGQGRVVHAAAGLTTDRFGDVVHDALLVAAGRLSVEQLDATIAGTAPPGTAEAELRARRLVRVARRLVHAKMHALAEERYLEAIGLVPELVEPRVELADLLVTQLRYSEAEHHYRRAWNLAPSSVDAACGVALTLACRGNAAGLTESRAIVDEILLRQPRVARAHYVKGLVQAAQGDVAGASASFRTAAELLLDLVPVEGIRR